LPAKDGTVLEGGITLAGNVDMAGASGELLLLASDEASEFKALRTALPVGWVAELQPDPGMAWVAFVYRADAPRSRPMFTICRWDERVGLFVQWMNGSASSAMVFTELWPILELILSSIFASTQKNLATVTTEGWDATRH